MLVLQDLSDEARDYGTSEGKGFQLLRKVFTNTGAWSSVISEFHKGAFTYNTHDERGRRNVKTSLNIAASLLRKRAVMFPKSNEVSADATIGEVLLSTARFQQLSPRPYLLNNAPEELVLSFIESPLPELLRSPVTLTSIGAVLEASIIAIRGDAGTLDNVLNSIKSPTGSALKILVKTSNHFGKIFIRPTLLTGTLVDVINRLAVDLNAVWEWTDFNDGNQGIYMVPAPGSPVMHHYVCPPTQPREGEGFSPYPDPLSVADDPFVRR